MLIIIILSEPARKGPHCSAAVAAHTDGDLDAMTCDEYEHPLWKTSRKMRRDKVLNTVRLKN